MPWRVLLLAAGVIAIAQAGIELDMRDRWRLCSSVYGCIGLFAWFDGRAKPDDRMLPDGAFNPRSSSGAVIAMVLLLSA